MRNGVGGELGVERVKLTKNFAPFSSLSFGALLSEMAFSVKSLGKICKIDFPLSQRY